MLFKKEADNLGILPSQLLSLNTGRLKGLQLSAWLKRDTWLRVKPGEGVGAADSEAPPPPQMHLVNRVVQIDGEDDSYAFWYVLTYLPDLQWCRVAPLESRGVFSRPSPDGHVAEGRPRWMLVPEEQGGEIDVGAGRCAPRRRTASQSERPLHPSASKFRLRSASRGRAQR